MFEKKEKHTCVSCKHQDNKIENSGGSRQVTTKICKARKKTVYDGSWIIGFIPRDKYAECCKYNLKGKCKKWESKE